jgi:hypothetical protein
MASARACFPSETGDYVLCKHTDAGYLMPGFKNSTSASRRMDAFSLLNQRRRLADRPLMLCLFFDMSSSEIYHAKAEELLRQATATEDFGERSRLISEAVHWHAMASASEGASQATEHLEKVLRDFDPDSWEAEEP